MSQEKFQEMQMLEQGLHSLMMQKQAFQMELSESKAALKEVEASNDDVFKMVGQLMIKSEKSKLIEDLKNKEKLLEVRLKTLERQESDISSKLEKIREELMKSRTAGKKN